MNDIREKMNDFLVENGYCLQESIDIVTSINGYNEETFKDILYAVSGYRDFDQIEEDFYNNEEDN